MKHTPGPWEAVCRAGDVGKKEWPEDEFLQWEVRGPREPSGRGDYYQADARLIAAAPELLEALKEVTAFVQPSLHVRNAEAMDALDRARAAIAKAEGA